MLYTATLYFYIFYIDWRDFVIKLTINKRVVEVKEGSTILQAAKKLGIFIPTFCTDDLERLRQSIA